MLNALRYTKALETAGFTEEQAKAAIDCWMEFMNAEFATKGDLKELEFVTKTAIQELDYKFNKRFDQIDLRFEQVDLKFKEIDSNLKQIRERFDQTDKSIETLEKRIDLKIENLENKLTLRLGGIMLAGITLLQFFPSILDYIRK